MAYVLDTLNAPKIARFGVVVKPVAHIEIGRYGAADFYHRDELPPEAWIAYQLDRQGYQLRALKESGDYMMVGYRREDKLP